MSLRIFQMLDFINNRLSNIEKNIARIDEKLEFSIALQRNHLIRIKNGAPINDQMILMGRPYNDLTPNDAYQIYSNPDMDFILLDVSTDHFFASNQDKISDAIHIPLEQLEKRYSQVQSKTTPILIISEHGLRSISACELLVKKGYYNVNNISGGYQYWPKAQDRQLQATGS